MRDLPFGEQILYNGPGSPLMVNESETLGPAPVVNDWFITASVLAYHHSPVDFG